MCVTLLGPSVDRKYDSSIPLEIQLEGCQQVTINYEPKDSSITSFMGELERLCKTGVSCNVNFEVLHNDNLSGARVKKQVHNFNNDLKLNEAIKILVDMQYKADKTLRELSLFCKR